MTNTSPTVTTTTSATYNLSNNNNYNNNYVDKGSGKHSTQTCTRPLVPTWTAKRESVGLNNKVAPAKSSTLL